MRWSYLIYSDRWPHRIGQRALGTYVRPPRLHAVHATLVSLVGGHDAGEEQGGEGRWQDSGRSLISLLYQCGIISSILHVGWLWFTSHQQRGHLETAPPLTVPCKGHEVWFLHRSNRELNPRPSHGTPLHNRCTKPAPHHFTYAF